MRTIFLICIHIFVVTSCNIKVDDIQSSVHGSNIPVIHAGAGKEIVYTLIRDKLYRDNTGNLYLRAVNKEDIEHGREYNVWLTDVYCDSCFHARENGLEHITVLKDFVDTESFHLIHSDTEQGGDIYADKNHRYFHKWMADGGTITLLPAVVVK